MLQVIVPICIRRQLKRMRLTLARVPRLLLGSDPRAQMASGAALGNHLRAIEALGRAVSAPSRSVYRIQSLRIARPLAGLCLNPNRFPASSG